MSDEAATQELMHPDQHFSSDPIERAIARSIFAHTQNLPIKAVCKLPPKKFLKSLSTARTDFFKYNFDKLVVPQTPLDELEIFEELKTHDFVDKLIPLYVADKVTDPSTEGFVDNIDAFGLATGVDAYTWKGYLEAHRIQREAFKVCGGTAVLFRPASAQATKLDSVAATLLFRKICTGTSDLEENDLFCAVMLFEFAKMSKQDGLDLHIQAGGESLPRKLEYIAPLRAIYQEFGDAPFDIVVFTHDETALSNELMPMAAMFSALRLSLTETVFSPRKLRVFREITAEIRDTRCDYSVRAEGDNLRDLMLTTQTIRRIDAGFLSSRVARHILSEEKAVKIAKRWTE